jgi:hypothetical protein
MTHFNAKPLTEFELHTVNAAIKQDKCLAEVCRDLGTTRYRLKKYLPYELYKALVSNKSISLSNQHRVGTISTLLDSTLEVAYMVGLLQADGCITDNGYICLTSVDKELVHHFCRITSSNIITDSHLGKPLYKGQVKDFKNFEKFKKHTNLYPRKTYECYTIPSWILDNSEALKYFFVGVFNGDGSVALKRNNIAQLQVEQHSSQFEFLKVLNDRLLGWRIYSYDYAKIQTCATIKNEEFEEVFCTNEYALLRKVLKMESIRSKI